MGPLKNLVELTYFVLRHSCEHASSLMNVKVNRLWNVSFGHKRIVNGNRPHFTKRHSSSLSVAAAIWFLRKPAPAPIIIFTGTGVKPPLCPGLISALHSPRLSVSIWPYICSDGDTPHK